jgi:hypothetical protein
MFSRIVRVVETGKVRLLGDEGIRGTGGSGDPDLDLFVRDADDDMFFVDQLPITDREMKPIDLPPNLAARVVSLSDIVAAARRDAVIDEPAHRHVAVGLPPATANPAPIPRRMVLSGLAATTLAGSDALEQIAAVAEVHLLATVLAEARANLQWSARRAEISTWLGDLRERLRSGLDDGRYIANGETDVDVEDARDLDLESLLDLLREGDETRATWVEDRACSRIVGSTIGIGDILADLRRRDAITAEAHAALTHTLRSSDLRYLPLNRDDLIVFVAAARTRERPDTKELQTVSRYMARIALDGNRSNGQAATAPEIAVLLDSANISASAIPEIWKEHIGDPERAIEQGGWFMNQVYAGRLAIRAASEPNASADIARDDAASDLAQLYMGAVLVGFRELPGEWEGSTTDRYVHWISSTFALRKFFTDPELIDATGKRLAALAQHFTQQFEAEEGLHDCTALIGAVFHLLPSELRHAWLAADPTFGERHGFRLADGVQVQGQRVPTDGFWTNLEEALVGTEQPDDAPVRVEITGERVVVSFEGKTLHIDDPLFLAFARGGPEACAEWAATHGDLLDMPREKREAEAKRIGGFETARERFTAGDALRARGARVFYQDLRKQLRAGGNIPESGFRLSIEVLIDELRWIPASGPDAAALIEDVGVEEAVRRLITLPTRLPNEVISALKAAPDCVDIVRRLAVSVAAPLSTIHTANLALRLANDESLRELGATLVDRLFSAEYEESEYEAFERAYAATNAWLSFDAGASDLAADDRLLLAFSHASRLIDTIGRKQARRAGNFFSAVASLSREALCRDPEFFDHLLYPTNIDYLRVVVLGLAATLRDVPLLACETGDTPQKVKAVLTRLKNAQSIGGLFKDVRLCRHGIATLLEADAHDAIVEIVGEVPYEIPTSAQLGQVLTQLLHHATENPEAGDWWKPVQAIVQQHPLPEGDLNSVRKIVANLANEDTRRGLGDKDIVMCLCSIAGPVASGEDASLCEQFKATYLAVARDFATGARDAASLTMVAPAFLEIALATAARPSQPVASAQALASHIDELIRVWPALAHALASRLSALVWTAPVDQSVPLWRVVLRAREDAL